MLRLTWLVTWDRIMTFLGSRVSENSAAMSSATVSVHSAAAAVRGLMRLTGQSAASQFRELWTWLHTENFYIKIFSHVKSHSWELINCCSKKKDLKWIMSAPFTLACKLRSASSSSSALDCFVSSVAGFWVCFFPTILIMIFHREKSFIDELRNISELSSAPINSL